MKWTITYFNDHDPYDIEPIVIEVETSNGANRKGVKEASSKADAIMIGRGEDLDDWPNVDIDAGQVIDWS